VLHLVPLAHLAGRALSALETVTGAEKLVRRLPPQYRRALPYVAAGGAGLAVYAVAQRLVGRAGAGMTDLDTIAACRARVPIEPGLKPQGSGHYYTGISDKDHLGYLTSYLQAKADSAGAGDRRKILAFLAILPREGTTAAINTYDNQIVTWGTGWGGLGGLGRVMGELVRDPTAKAALEACGLSYLGGNQYAVADLDGGQTVTGQKPALEVVRRTPALLHLLISVAKDPATRDAVTEAQLAAWMATSGNLPGGDAIFTQALYNFCTHLKHWAPGYMDGAVTWAASQVAGDPSETRDRQLAPLVVRYFYAKAKGKWIPAWKQMQQYVGHVKADGLDVSADPVLAASSPPTDDFPPAVAGADQGAGDDA
jgi:hypothetical protein